MTKKEIENAFLFGSNRVTGADVVRRSRGRKAAVLTYRHCWADDADARVIDGVTRAARLIAREIAQETGRDVEIHDPRGWLCVVVEAGR